ncbi:hypothetical protein K457DRAFT_1589130 [Linnemannia elongata AG-77]|uniref:Uncharacterized protein n=1 Tax=Linnemannia elongata AG-77 TaxID=1314771 RepID=A0A197JM93_9FUNG|nr:hypothetical protein K457DRAFT_1589130 [Linnemannia elongata AG-77]
MKVDKKEKNKKEEKEELLFVININIQEGGDCRRISIFFFFFFFFNKTTIFYCWGPSRGDDVWGRCACVSVCVEDIQSMGFGRLFSFSFSIETDAKRKTLKKHEENKRGKNK